MERQGHPRTEPRPSTARPGHQPGIPFRRQRHDVRVQRLPDESERRVERKNRRRQILEVADRPGSQRQSGSGRNREPDTGRDWIRGLGVRLRTEHADGPNEKQLGQLHRADHGEHFGGRKRRNPRRHAHHDHQPDRRRRLSHQLLHVDYPLQRTGLRGPHASPSQSHGRLAEMDDQPGSPSVDDEGSLLSASPKRREQRPSLVEFRDIQRPSHQ